MFVFTITSNNIATIADFYLYATTNELLSVANVR